MNRRGYHRSRRRMRVRLEPGRIRSFTGDVSRGGVFVYSQRLLAPGTPVRLEIDLPEGTGEADGVVRWAKRAPPQFAVVARGGMGIEFTRISETLRAYLDTDHTLLARKKS